MAHHLKTKKSRFSPFWFLLILIPLFAAVYFYFALNPESVVAGAYTEARISYAGKESAFAGEDTIESLKSAVTTGKQVIESPRALSEYTAATLTLSDALHNAQSYTLYLTSSAKDCYYKDRVDALFAMNADDALRLLTMDEFDFVYPSVPPKMTLMLDQNANVIEPSYDSWKFVRADGSEKEVSGETEPPVFVRTDETLSVVFEREPTSATLLIRNANTGAVLFSGAPEKLSVFAPSWDPLLRVEITAHYEVSDSYAAYGAVRYAFFVNWNPGSSPDTESGVA